MTHLYYFLTIIFICIQASYLVSPMKYTNNAKRFHELANEFKGKQYVEFSNEYKGMIKNKVWLIFGLLWLFLGIFTFQWIAYLTYIVFNVIVISPLLTLTRYSFVYTVIHWIGSFISLLFWLFVILNHYHLKLDLTTILLSYFK